MAKVLVVDDEAAITDFVCNFLKRLKIATEKAGNGEAAIEAFKKTKPDWVFLDLKMPDMDGFEVIKELKKIDPNVKIIMITGSEERESQTRAKKLGAVDYITKPLDLEDLHQKIQTYILQQ